MKFPVSICAVALLLAGCVEKVTDTADSEVDDPSSAPISTGDEIAEASVCDEEYSLCGNIYVPMSMTNAPRQLVVALYRSIPPSGSPDLVVDQIDAPSVVAGEKYPIRIYPFLESGEYYIWTNLYMEGGGDYEPVNDVDFTGHSEEMIVLDGSAIKFDDIVLSAASGW